MRLDTENIVDLIKYFGALATAATIIIGAVNAWSGVQKSKAAFDPSVNKEMVSSMHEDSRVRREYMEQMGKVHIALSETMTMLSKNHFEARSETEAMHRNTHSMINALEKTVSKDLGNIQANQKTTIEEIKNVGKILAGGKA